MSLRLRSAALLATVALLASGCSTLKEKDPFRVSVSYDLDQTKATVTTPDEIVVNARFGFVQVVNNTEEKMNFDIDDLAVFESILPGRSKEVQIDEARNNRSYIFYDHTHPGLIQGLMIVRFSDKKHG
jgi:hypothetical protein